MPLWLIFVHPFLSLHELPNKVRSQEGALCGGEGGGGEIAKPQIKFAKSFSLCDIFYLYLYLLSCIKTVFTYLHPNSVDSNEGTHITYLHYFINCIIALFKYFIYSVVICMYHKSPQDHLGGPHWHIVVWIL